MAQTSSLRHFYEYIKKMDYVNEAYERMKTEVAQAQRVSDTEIWALEKVRDETQSSAEHARCVEALRWHGRMT